MKSIYRFALDFGPVILFFAAYKLIDIFFATLVFMDATTISLLITYLLHRKLTKAQLSTACVVLALGALTLFLHDEQYIKIKPTLLYSAAGFFILVSLMRGKPAAKMLLGHVLTLTLRGWKQITLRASLFCFCLAGLNEYIWRNYSTDIWINFKLFGITTLIMMFMLCQIPLVKREWVEQGDDSLIQ